LRLKLHLLPSKPIIISVLYAGRKLGFWVFGAKGVIVLIVRFIDCLKIMNVKSIFKNEVEQRWRRKIRRFQRLK
jgi:hypothetical protein